MQNARSLIYTAWSMAAILSVLTAGPLAADPTDHAIFGRWLTDDGKGIVTIAPCGERLCGRISQVLDRTPGVPATDVNNPESVLRRRAILGLPVLSGFRRDGRQWGGGRAYDPKSGNSYRSRLSLNPDGSLRVTGCVLFVCQSKRWRRVG